MKRKWQASDLRLLTFLDKKMHGGIRVERLLSWLMLVVFAVFPSWVLVKFHKSAQHAEQASICIDHLKQIGVACHMYSQDHDGKFPGALLQLYPQYVSRMNIFFCPGAPNAVRLKGTRTPEDEDISYVYFPGFTEEDDKNIIIARDKSLWNHYSLGGMNYCCVDGHVAFFPMGMYFNRDFDSIAFALREFFADKGRYPTDKEGLKALVNTGYLRIPPLDPFDKEGKRLYGYAFNAVQKKWLITTYRSDGKQDIALLNLFLQGKLTNEALVGIEAEHARMPTFKFHRIKGNVFSVFRIGQ
jgi:hypothetical protein